MPDRVFIEDVVGLHGRQLSGSKTAKPGHTVFWNACIFNAKGEQIWYGDIDLTTESDKLQEAANLFGTLYVTRESPFRWDGLKKGLRDSNMRNVPEHYYRIFKPATPERPQWKAIIMDLGSALKKLWKRGPSSS
jgi:hypothetical protein